MNKMAGLNDNILVMTLYYIFAGCYHWVKLDKEYIGSLRITSYNMNVQLSQNFKFNLKNGIMEADIYSGQETGKEVHIPHWSTWLQYLFLAPNSSFGKWIRGWELTLIIIIIINFNDIKIVAFHFILSTGHNFTTNEILF